MSSHIICEHNGTQECCCRCKFHYKIHVCHCGTCPVIEGYMCLFPHIDAGNYGCTYKTKEHGMCEYFKVRDHWKRLWDKMEGGKNAG